MAGTWDTFEEINEGNGTIALRSDANSLIVTAGDGGAAPLIANGTVVESGEIFRLIRNSNGTISLRARANGKYITAAGASSALIASGTRIGAAQEFALIQET